MPLSSLKQAFKSSVATKQELRKLADGIDSRLNCISHFESLEDKGGYNFGKQFPQELHKSGIYQQLLQRWLSDRPDVHVLRNVGYGCSASQAGREWAKFLRVRNDDATILRVYVKDREAGPEMILLQLLGSLVWSMIQLVPDRFERSEEICKRTFDIFTNQGRQSFDAGVLILRSLPQLGPKGERMLCVVDGLDLAETDQTREKVKELVDVLRDLLAHNGGHLLYTLERTSAVIR